MTVDDLIATLQTLSKDGYGEAPVMVTRHTTGGEDDDSYDMEATTAALGFGYVVPHVVID